MLTKEEANNLIHIGVSQNVISPEYNVGSTNIFAFTENGVSMLSSVLRSPLAIQININIMRTFTRMRQLVQRYLSNYNLTNLIPGVLP